jgi:tRNA dimethylallyltransferase
MGATQQQPIVFVVAGPTASGKTAISVALAQALGTAVISADSRQCYSEMQIGTARPTLAEQGGVPHYFIGSHSVTQELSAAHYQELALGYLNEVFAHTPAAVVCGGTGLYIKALCHGLDPMPTIPAHTVAATEEAYRQQGLAWLQQAIATEDPLFAATGELQNPARMLRALSFVRATGTSITTHRSNTPVQRPFRIIKVGLEWPREELYHRINQRVDNMIAAGLVDEVRTLLPYKHLKTLRTVGYDEIFRYLDGEWTLPHAIEKIKQHTRNYAKRQLTWFRADADMVWLPANNPAIVQQIQVLAQKK